MRSNSGGSSTHLQRAGLVLRVREQHGHVLAVVVAARDLLQARVEHEAHVREHALLLLVAVELHRVQVEQVDRGVPNSRAASNTSV
jgi:hypothetical protein